METNQKKIKIINTAEKLFAENGFDGTSVRQIAKAAAVNVAMISYYFGSKEKLLESIMLYRISDYFVELNAALNPQMSPQEKIDTFIRVVIIRVHRNRRMHKIVNYEYAKESRQINFDRFVDQRKENYKVIEELIKEGQQEGCFRKDLQMTLIVPTILGTYFHFYYNKQFFQSILNLTDDLSLDAYVQHNLIPHIQTTIKALLTYEN